MRRFHILVVRHSPFDFATQRDAALCAKAKFLCPMKNRFRTRLDADLIKPGVTRFSERLYEIQRTMVRLFPVMKGGIANLDRRHAVEFVVRANGAALQRSDPDRDFEG